MKTRTFKMTMIAVAVSALVACFLMLTACGANVAANTLYAFETDASGIHVVAQNGADGSDSETITVDPGHGLVIESTVNKGAFHVKATNSDGMVVFDEDIEDSALNLVSVAGEVEVEVDAIAADGTLEITASDPALSASAEAASSEAASSEAASSEAASSASSSAA